MKCPNCREPLKFDLYLHDYMYESSWVEVIVYCEYCKFHVDFGEGELYKFENFLNGKAEEK